MSCDTIHIVETGGDIIVQASAEDVVILNDTAQVCKCGNCGHEITVSAGIVLGDQIRTLGSNADITTCPNCGSSIQISKPDPAV